MKQSPLHFTGILAKEGKQYVGLCLELDVSSFGETRTTAKTNLEEAVCLYLESAVESNLPFIRPVPKADIPKRIAEKFPLLADLKISARAA